MVYSYFTPPKAFVHLRVAKNYEVKSCFQFANIINLESHEKRLGVDFVIVLRIRFLVCSVFVVVST